MTARRPLAKPSPPLENRLALYPQTMFASQVIEDGFEEASGVVRGDAAEHLGDHLLVNGAGGLEPLELAAVAGCGYVAKPMASRVY